MASRSSLGSGGPPGPLPSFGIGSASAAFFFASSRRQGEVLGGPQAVCGDPLVLRPGLPGGGDAVLAEEDVVARAAGVAQQTLPRRSAYLSSPVFKSRQTTRPTLVTK
jgi:hypothetical protein